MTDVLIKDDIIKVKQLKNSCDENKGPRDKVHLRKEYVDLERDPVHAAALRNQDSFAK